MLARFIPAALIAASTVRAAFARAEDVKVGFILSTLQEERYAKDRTYFEDEAKKLGAKVVFAACDNSG